MASQDHRLAVLTRVEVRIFQALNFETGTKDREDHFDSEFKLPVVASLVEVSVLCEVLKAVVLDNLHHSEVV